MTERTRSTPYDYVAPIFFVIFSIAFLVVAHRYAPASREVPVAVGYAGLALAFVDLLTRLRTPLGRKLKQMLSAGTEPVKVGRAEAGLSVAREGAAILWLVGFVVVTLTVGLLATIPSYVYLYMTTWGRRTRAHAVIGAIGATAFTYVLFELVLRYPLYRGVLFN